MRPGLGRAVVKANEPAEQGHLPLEQLQGVGAVVLPSTAGEKMGVRGVGCVPRSRFPPNPASDLRPGPCPATAALRTVLAYSMNPYPLP